MIKFLNGGVADGCTSQRKIWADAWQSNFEMTCQFEPDCPMNMRKEQASLSVLGAILFSKSFDRRVFAHHHCYFSIKLLQDRYYCRSARIAGVKTGDE